MSKNLGKRLITLQPSLHPLLSSLWVFFPYKKRPSGRGTGGPPSQYARRRRGNVRMDLVSAARVLRERREEGSRRRRCDGSSGNVVKVRADRVRFRAFPARLMTTIRPSRSHSSEKARRLRLRMRIVYQAKPDNAGEQFSVGKAGSGFGVGVRAQIPQRREQSRGRFPEARTARARRPLPKPTPGESQAC